MVGTIQIDNIFIKKGCHMQVFSFISIHYPVDFIPFGRG
jgi:hypothetical protein